MSRGVRAVVALVTLTAVMPLASCGGGGGNSLRATLTDDDCTYEGDTSPDTGRFTIDLENKTKFFGKFALARLSDGKTINDLHRILRRHGGSSLRVEHFLHPRSRASTSRSSARASRPDRTATSQRTCPQARTPSCASRTTCRCGTSTEPRNSTSPGRRSARRSARAA